MRNQERLITIIYYLVNVMLALNYIGLVLFVALISVLALPIPELRETFSPVFENLSLPWLLVLVFASLVNGILWILVLRVIKQFLKNLLAEEIFTDQNVSLARKTSIYMVLLAFFSNSSGIIEFGFGGSHLSFFNLTYLLAALLVWVLSIVLERAVAIAKENEFTI